ncbi:acid protease [Rickenella mellea]|uniref:Acid protease n=1 Tax=Rickenella mellea TaxID=50990 RepID=A0A4Y7Q7A0_9AGAM|nr:acid protease [Rickenella mellea]
MKVALFPLSLLFVLLHGVPTNAIKFPVLARPRAGSLTRRMDMTGGSAELSNSGDITYFCNISLGGIQHSALIDTGSSDLWVTKNVTDAKVLGVQAAVTYAIGSASGPVQLSTLIFDDFTFKQNLGVNLPADALIGLGPGSNSIVRLKVGNSTGDPPLDRIFQQNMTTPNFISVLLDRKADDNAGTTDPLYHAGQLTIGEVVPGLEAVNNQPRLPALKDSRTGRPTHWQASLDAEGVIGPDGQPIAVSSAVPTNTNASLLQVVFDSGFSLPQVPEEVADGIYGRVPGSKFISQGDIGVWTYPCDYELNVSFKLGGVSYPVHPLDLGIPVKSDPKTCLATFQQRSDTLVNFTDVDMILGMAFMRNTYVLINFGDFVDGSSSNVADPYIQLLSITNVTNAHSDFVKIRLGGVDATGAQATLLPVNTIASRKRSAKKSVPFLVGMAVIAILGLALFCVLIVCLVRRRRRRLSGTASSLLPPVRGTGSYKPLTGGQDDKVEPEPPTYGAGYGNYQEPNYHYGQA